MGSLGNAKCEKLSNCQPWQKQLHTPASGWHRNNTLLKPMKHYGPCLHERGWAWVYRFFFLCGTKSKYIRLIQLCAIYDATHCFLVTWAPISWDYSFALKTKCVCDIAGVTFCIIKALYMKASHPHPRDVPSSFNPFSGIFSHNAHYQPHNGPVKYKKNPRTLFPAVTQNPDLLKSSTLTFVWKSLIEPEASAVNS